MRIKDYYKILDVLPTASQPDIKKAFRQLAMQYHPDKNAGNELSKAHFIEIKEAYQILSDPDRRSAYTQQRWFRHTRKDFHTEHVTPSLLLKKCRQLSHYIVSARKHSNLAPARVSGEKY